MDYFDYLDNQEMSKQPTKYFEKKKIINFDIIHHEWRSDPLEGTYERYQTVKKKGFRKISDSRKNRNNFWLG